jgi:hypothetical protein
VGHRAQHRNPRHHDDAAMFGGREQALRSELPMRKRGFLPGKGGDVFAGIAQRAQRLAFGQRDRLVEFKGPGHRWADVEESTTKIGHSAVEWRF